MLKLSQLNGIFNLWEPKIEILDTTLSFNGKWWGGGKSLFDRMNDNVKSLLKQKLSKSI